MTSVEKKILLHYETLHPSEKRVADYILAHVQTVFHLPIAQLAAASGVSQASWVRFAKTLGYSGLKDLKKALFMEMNWNSEPEETPRFQDIRDFSDIESLSRAVKENSQKAIEDTFQVLNTTVVEQTIERMRSAPTVRLFGVGASATVAEDFASKLMRIGVPVCFHHDLHLQLSYAANTDPKDLCLFISHSGATVEVLETLDIAKSAGALCLSITKLQTNPLARRSDLQLYTLSPELYHRSGAMSSRLAQLFLIDILYTAIANRHYDHVVPRLARSQERCLTHRLGPAESSETK